MFHRGENKVISNSLTLAHVYFPPWLVPYVPNIPAPSTMSPIMVMLDKTWLRLIKTAH